MNELIMPHNIGVKNALENMKEILSLYKKGVHFKKWRYVLLSLKMLVSGIFFVPLHL